MKSRSELPSVATRFIIIPKLSSEVKRRGVLLCSTYSSAELRRFSSDAAEFLEAIREYSAASEEKRRNSALEYVLQSKTPRRFTSELSFGMMMNLVATLGSSDRDFIWKYLTRYDAAIAGDPETEAMGRALVECA